jgi:hypothetical protein
MRRGCRRLIKCPLVYAAYMIRVAGVSRLYQMVVTKKKFHR